VLIGGPFREHSSTKGDRWLVGLASVLFVLVAMVVFLVPPRLAFDLDGIVELVNLRSAESVSVKDCGSAARRRFWNRFGGRKIVH
jgi:hypothetical protein